MNLIIEFGHSFEVAFQILDTPIAKLWLERMTAKEQYPLDNPDRFYGFNSQVEEEIRALQMIQDCVATINKHQPIIDRELTDVYDQDTLNYLHNIFERYHGLLDHQDQEFWVNAPDDVHRALAQLNLAVHRCEGLERGNFPRFVCTWYGLPKTKTLTDELIKQYGDLNPKFGSVCLCYAEIGKTLEHLTADRDNYIADDAFKPFDHYSADFVVRLHQDDHAEIAKRLAHMEQYYQQHQEFFCKQGYTKFDHPRLLPFKFPVAELIENMPRQQLIDKIRQHQVVTKVEIR